MCVGHVVSAADVWLRLCGMPSALSGLRTCEINRESRVADGFLAWPRREGGGNTRCGLAPTEQRRPGQKDTQPFGREQKRPSGGVARSVTPPAAGRPRGRLPKAARQGEIRREADESTRRGMRLRERLAIRPFLLSRGFFLFISQVLTAPGRAGGIGGSPVGWGEPGVFRRPRSAGWADRRGP